MANGDDILAQGILQAGQSIGAGLQAAGQNRQRAIMAKQKALSDERKQVTKNAYDMFKIQVQIAGTLEGSTNQINHINNAGRAFNAVNNSIRQTKGLESIPYQSINRVTPEMTQALKDINEVQNDKNLSTQAKEDFVSGIYTKMFLSGNVSDRQFTAFQSGLSKQADREISRSKERREQVQFKEQFPQGAESVVA